MEEREREGERERERERGRDGRGKEREHVIIKNFQYTSHQRVKLVLFQCSVFH